MLKLIITLLVSLNTLYALGETYPIVEPDFIQEIEDDAPQIKKRIEKDLKEATKRIEDYTGEVLKKSKKDSITYIDPTFVLDRDIPKYNKMGQHIGTLYKKGFKFNPIKYLLVTPPDMIVFNVCDEDESKHVKDLLETNKYKDKHNYMLVNSGCKNKEVKKSDFNRKVYFLTKEMVEKFNLKETISIISVDKVQNQIKVQVVSLHD